jgi:hypothetical protein
MSAQTTIANLRYENLVKTALLKRACGEPLNAQEREVMDEIAKARELDRALREKFELGGAIEKVLRSPTSNQTGPGAYSASGDTTNLQKARDEALKPGSAAAIRKRAGLPEPNFDTMPDGTVPTKKQANPKTKMKWGIGSDPNGGK